MELKRVESSKQRLQEKITEGKRYLQKEVYDVSELVRWRTHLEKKKAQFGKDIEEFVKVSDKDDPKIDDYECLKIEAEDILDDLQHYIDVKKREVEADEKRIQQEAEERKVQREAEEKKIEREAEERKWEAEKLREVEEREKERQYNLEMERIKAEERMTKLQIEEKIAIERLHVEKMKVETERESTTSRHNAKASVKLPKIHLTKFDGDILKWSEFWDIFEATVHQRDDLHNVDKFGYLKGQLLGAASEVLSGLELTNDNYNVAVQLLKERYGRKQFLIDAHYAKMMNIPMATYRASSLRSFYNVTEKHLRCLKTFGENENQRQILTMLTSKLPRSVLLELEKMKPEGEEWTVRNFRKLLHRHINSQEACDLKMKLFHRNDDSPRQQTNTNRSPNMSYSSAGESLFFNENMKTKYGKKCIFCRDDHWSDECQQYPDIQSRKNQLKNRCLKCMKEDHRIKDCKVLGKVCVHCGEKDKHHRTLCPKKFKQQEDSNTNTSEENETESGMVAIGETVIMKTALVTMKSNNVTATSRAFFDSGSSRTYISEEFMNTLKLKPVEKQKFFVNTFGKAKREEKNLPTVNLIMKTKFGSDINIKATVIKQITGPLQRTPLNLKDRKNINSNFELADTIPTRLETYNLGLLIGNDYYDDIVLGERRKIQENLYLLKSKVGWIISGRTKDDQQQHENTMFVVSATNQIAKNVVHMDEKQDVTSFEPHVEDLWKLESIGIRPKDSTEKNDIAMEMFQNTVTKEGERYFISWPWRNEYQIMLPENYELSLGRLKSLMKHLQKDPELLQRYDETIRTQIQNGVIEKVESTEINNKNKKHYIPHHGVIKPDSATTKLRIVYDASAKTKKGNKSLNECLHRGPVILEDLCGLLIRFRTKKIGMIADIEKAFLQIGIHDTDRDVTRFLWLNDINKPISEDNIGVYRFARLPFGIISSPFLLGATIQHHMENAKNPVANKIKDDIYVDNVITGTDKENEAVELYHNTKALFRDASMNLREWITNSKEVNSQIAPEDQIDAKVTKVLGLVWNTNTDELSISTKRFNQVKGEVTKRNILATIASIYDPLGMLTPATIRLKIFLQELWQKQLGWDDSLDTNDEETWNTLTKNLQELSTIQQPRFIGNEESKLIGFCDASSKAYATAIYLRTVIDGKVQTNLIFSKSRNAPKKELTIPRLELMSTLIGVRCLRFIAKELKLEDTDKILWTDSQCVLKWIQQEENNEVFVRNRVKEITERNDITFRYINTKENPADLPTRGISVPDLKTNKLWWNGPEWLLKNPKDWPQWNTEIIDPIFEDKSDDKDIIFEIAATQPEVEQTVTPFEIDPTKYTSFTKLLRVTAFANRFVRNTTEKSRSKHQAEVRLTSGEIDDAELLWIKYVQKKHYITNGQLSQKQKQNQLNPSIYADGIIRLNGRFVNSNLPEEAKSPILLPREEYFTKLLINNVHAEICHGGTAHTLARLRQKYWIPQGRTAIKAVLKKCLTCIRFQGGPYKIKPVSPWPKSRVTVSSPFTNTGVDYFGPLYIKSVGPQTKVWICLFTCTAVRAIHLEVVENMSAESFLEALRRFIARRGKPDEIISDNATNFKAARNTVNIVWKNIVNDPQVHGYLSAKRIKWKFIIELSPWMGGFYERLVGTTKMALKKSIGKLHLTLTQLQTIITEVESVVNSRPLIYVDNDLENEIITPAHFLSLNPKTGTPVLQNIDEDDDQIDPDYQNIDKSTAQKLLDTWKKGNRHLEQFWKVWKDQYLLNLRERNQKFNKHPRIQSEREAKVGDVVQVKEPTPRGTWKIGRIVEMIRSQDGEERAARILMPNKNVLQRSITHLYPLECHEDEQQSSNEIKQPEQGPQERKNQQDEIHEDNESNTTQNRPRRRAAQEARDKIVGQTLLDD